MSTDLEKEPMARPVQQRTSKSYARDGEHLTRLRTAVQFDARIPLDRRKEVVHKIDDVIESLATLVGEIS